MRDSVKKYNTRELRILSWRRRKEVDENHRWKQKERRNGERRERERERRDLRHRKQFHLEGWPSRATTLLPFSVVLRRGNGEESEVKVGTWVYEMHTKTLLRSRVFPGVPSTEQPRMAVRLKEPLDFRAFRVHKHARLPSILLLANRRDEAMIQNERRCRSHFHGGRLRLG